MSGTAPVFNAQIKGVDEATGVFAKVAKSLHGLVESTKSLATATKGLGHTAATAATSHQRFLATLGAHFRLLHGHIGSVNAGIVSVRNSLSELIPAIGALGAGATFAGLLELTHSVSEAQVALVAMTQKLGISETQLLGLSYAAKVSAVPVETVTRSIERLNKTVGQTVVGHDKQAAALFHHLRISLKDANGHIRSAGDLMPQLADAFRKTRDPAMQAYMAFTLFGRAGQEMLPMLLQGGDAIRELTAEGAKLAYITTPEQKRSLREFADSWIGLEAAVGGFKTEIGAELAPVLAPLIAMAKEWVLANRDWIAQGIAAKVKLLADGLRQLDIEEIVRQTTEWVHWTMDLINHLGGMRTVIGALVLMLGSPLIEAVRGAIEIFFSLGRVLLSLGAILWANPILLAIAAVAAAGFLLYENWAWVKEKVGAIFVWFSGQKEWVKDLLTAIMPIVFVPMQIVEHWEPIKAFFINLWAEITGGFVKAMADIQPIIDRLMQFGDWVAHLSLGHIADDVKSALSIGPSPAPFLHGYRPPAATAPNGEGTGQDNAARAGWWGSWGGGPLPAPSLYREGGPAAAAAVQPPQKGTVTVNITGSNMAPGTVVTTTSSGIAQVGTTDVGHISPMPNRN
jgi:hypothetical protein